MEKIRVSVVIPTYNRRKLLEKTINALFQQEYPLGEYEIIVVDDGSTDGTEEMIKDLSKNSSCSLRYFKQKNSGPAAARNRGIKEAKGEIIAFTDDDCAPFKNWIKNGFSKFADDKIIGVKGCTLPEKPLDRHFYPTYYLDTMEVTDDDEFSYFTCNMFYRRDSLLEVEGFDERYKVATIEDSDLAWKIKEKGGAVVFCPDVKVHHAVVRKSHLNMLKKYRTYKFFPLFYREHPKLRNRLILGFILSRTHLYPMFAAITVLSLLLVSLTNLTPIYVVYPPVLATMLFYLWSSVFIDQKVERYILRILVFPVLLIFLWIKMYYCVVGSIKYRSFIL